MTTTAQDANTLDALQLAIRNLRALTAAKLGPDGSPDGFAALLSDPDIHERALKVARCGLAHMRATWPAEHAAQLPPAAALDTCTDEQLEAAVQNSMSETLRKG